MCYARREASDEPIDFLQKLFLDRFQFSEAKLKFPPSLAGGSALEGDPYFFNLLLGLFKCLQLLLKGRCFRWGRVLGPRQCWEGSNDTQEANQNTESGEAAS